MKAGWQKGFEDMMTFKGALASVALSHPADHDCEVCRAASGDEKAFARLYEASQNRLRDTGGERG